jgi:hypothetical protein
MKKASKERPRARALVMDPPRRATRVPTSIDIKWGFGEVCAYAGTIINLTVFGCAVHNKEEVDVQPGQIVFIQFWMPSERILKVEVRHTALQAVQGFGARFLDLTDEETDTLEQLVRLFGEPHRDEPPKSK